MIAAVTFIYHGGCSLLEKLLGVKDEAPGVRPVEHRAKDPYSLGLSLHARSKDGAIVRDHSGNFVYNNPKTSWLENPTLLLGRSG